MKTQKGPLLSKRTFPLKQLNICMSGSEQDPHALKENFLNHNNNPIHHLYLSQHARF